MAEKRRLPVISAKSESASKSADPEADDAARPPWHWVVLGILLTFAAWLPLAYLATMFSRSVVLPRLGLGGEGSPAEMLAALPESRRAHVGMALAAPQALGAALAAFSGAFVSGRFGTGMTLRLLAMVGAGVATLATLMTVTSGGSLVVALVAFFVLVPAAIGGGFMGLRVRARSEKPGPA